MGGATLELVRADGAGNATCACLSVPQTFVNFPLSPGALKPPACVQLMSLHLVYYIAKSVSFFLRTRARFETRYYPSLN